MTVDLCVDLCVGNPNSCLLQPSVLNVKALAGAFNEEMALVGAYSIIVTCDIYSKVLLKL